MGFKENLREELKFQDIRQKELSEKTGISVNTLRNYINDHNALPNIYSAVKIAKALKTTVEQLVEGTNPAYSDSEKNCIALFKKLSENDRKSVIALMTEMSKH